MAATDRIRAAAAVLVLLAALLPETQGNYCDICHDHTMCLYQGFGQNCHKVIASGTKETDARAVLEAHNKLRERVASGGERRGNPGPQPPAADMNALVWDEELAKIAQRWADQCTFSHDACRKVERFQVGQNLYLSSTTGSVNGPDWQAAVKAWYEEVTDFSRNNVDRYKFSAQTGHYSQVVWADTKTVGCGYTAFSKPNGWKSALYVCNYGPTGNFIGRRVYTAGKSSSQCREGCHSTYPSLCA